VIFCVAYSILLAIRQFQTFHAQAKGKLNNHDPRFHLMLTKMKEKDIKKVKDLTVRKVRLLDFSSIALSYFFHSLSWWSTTTLYNSMGVLVSFKSPKR
jgi:hypothetical protein